MSAYMICNKEAGYFGFALIRFLNNPMHGYHTRTLLDKVWPYQPWKPDCKHEASQHMAHQVRKLCRLMLIMNRRAIWHRYALGRKNDRHTIAKEYTRVNELPNAVYPTVLELEGLAMTKFLSCTVYQCSEYTEPKPRNLVLLCDFERALDADVLHSLKVWEDAPWGRMSGHIAK